MKSSQINEARVAYFAAVMDAGSIRGAADRLGLEASVLSRQIQTLERELGVQLFLRSARGVTPTEAAAVLLSYARAAQSNVNQLKAQLEELTDAKRGLIRLAVAEGFIEPLVAYVLRDFSRAHEKVEVTLSLVSSVEAVRMVAEDTADIGLAINPPPAQQVLVHNRRARPTRLVVWPTHRLASCKTAVSLDELLHEPLALMSPGYGLRQMTQLAGYIERASLRPKYVTSSVAALKLLVRNELAITFMSDAAVESDVRRGELRTVPLESAVFNATEVQLIVSAGKTLSNASQRLIAYIDQHIF